LAQELAPGLGRGLALEWVRGLALGKELRKGTGWERT